MFQYCTCPAGRVTYDFCLSCKHMHMPFKSVCNLEHNGVICNMTSLSNSSQSTRPTGQVLGKIYPSFPDLLVIKSGPVEFLSPALYLTTSHVIPRDSPEELVVLYLFIV